MAASMASWVPSAAQAVLSSVRIDAAVCQGRAVQSVGDLLAVHRGLRSMSVEVRRPRRCAEEISAVFGQRSAMVLTL